MRIPEVMIKAVHRLVGLKNGTISFEKRNGEITQVLLNGLPLPKREWTRFEDLIEQKELTAIHSPANIQP